MSRSSEPAHAPDAPSRRAIPCGCCGTAVDPLHAARVRIIGERFHYFCSVDCADDFSVTDDEDHDLDIGAQLPAQRSSSPALDAAGSVTLSGSPSPPPSAAAPMDPSSAAAETTARTSEGARGLGTGRPPPPPPAARDAFFAEPDLATNAQRSAQLVRAAELGVEAPKSERWLGFAFALGWIAIGLLLAEMSALTQALRVLSLVLGNLAFLVFALFVEPKLERRVAPMNCALSWLALVLLGVVFSVQPQSAITVTNFASTLLVACSGTTLLLRRLFRPIDAARVELETRLNRHATRVVGDQLQRVTLSELRPGEEIVVHAGETVVADVTVVAGRAEVLPWVNASAVHSVGPEHFIYAGAQLTSGQVRATVRWTGLDRHWLRLTNDPTRRADLHSPLVAFSRKLTWRGAPLLVLVALLTGASASSSVLNGVMVALASLAALFGASLDRLVGYHTLQAVLSALNHGIVFRSPTAFDAAGRVSTAVFCARGTLLLGEPELSNIEVTGKISEDEVLALATGAELAQQTPTAIALLRAARARGVVPDAVRSPQAEAGLGIIALASNGKALVVGSRGLLLRERVSVARAEARITELEALGRSVLLVALGGHLVGLLALQDGLRAGARAAVQHLLDAEIEPVLLSGDARKSCEALGRTIDIEHLRPEVLPAERGREVERLRSGGAQVAVIGQSPTDEVALSAASVSIALPSAGTPNLDHDVELATNEVQRAALALGLARHCRSRATYSLAIAAGGALATVLGAVALSAPLAFVPLGCLCFTLIAAVSAQTSESVGAPVTGSGTSGGPGA